MDHRAHISQIYMTSAQVGGWPEVPSALARPRLSPANHGLQVRRSLELDPPATAQQALTAGREQLEKAGVRAVSTGARMLHTSRSAGVPANICCTHQPTQLHLQRGSGLVERRVLCRGAHRQAVGVAGQHLGGSQGQRSNAEDAAAAAQISHARTGERPLLRLPGRGAWWGGSRCRRHCLDQSTAPGAGMLSGTWSQAGRINSRCPTGSGCQWRFQLRAQSSRAAAPSAAGSDRPKGSAI